MAPRPLASDYAQLSPSPTMQRRTLLIAGIAACPSVALALYDPKPNELLVPAAGAWKGSLTYRDWSRPDKLVTLPCRLAVSLLAPEELALYYVFDDGPGKIVYSYERMAFDFRAGTLRWASGIAKPEASEYTVTSAGPAAGGSEIRFERVVEERTDRYVFVLGASEMSLGKQEVSASGEQTFRNRYEFRRSEG